MTQTDELEVLFPQGEVVTIRGNEQFHVKPLVADQFLEVAKRAKKIAEILFKDKDGKSPDDYASTLMNLILEGGDDFYQLVSFGVGMPREEFGKLSMTDMAKIVNAFIKVNEDFFVQWVMPIITSLFKPSQKLG